MKRTVILLTSALLNVALLAVVVWQAGWLRPETVGSRPSGTTGQETTPASSSGSGGFQAEAESTAKPTVRITPLQDERTDGKPSFDWRRVESPDYRAYIQNLRAIGCPEQTVRDIVTADVVQNFAGKRRETAAAALGDFKYWETGDTAAGRRSDLAKRERAVDEQMTTALGALLGADVSLPEVSRVWQTAVSEQQLAFLPAEKRAEAMGILERGAIGEVEVPHAAGDRLDADQAEDLQRRLEIYDRKKEQLSAVLSPEEFEKVDMSVSWTADNLRRAMRNFQPTAEEFQVIFREWRAHDERIARLWATGEPDPGNAQVFERIRQALGDQRFEEYRSTWWK